MAQRESPPSDLAGSPASAYSSLTARRPRSSAKKRRLLAEQHGCLAERNRVQPGLGRLTRPTPQKSASRLSVITLATQKPKPSDFICCGSPATHLAWSPDQRARTGFVGGSSVSRSWLCPCVGPLVFLVWSSRPDGFVASDIIKSGKNANVSKRALVQSVSVRPTAWCACRGGGVRPWPHGGQRHATIRRAT